VSLGFRLVPAEAAPTEPVARFLEVCRRLFVNGDVSWHRFALADGAPAPLEEPRDPGALGWGLLEQVVARLAGDRLVADADLRWSRWREDVERLEAEGANPFTVATHRRQLERAVFDAVPAAELPELLLGMLMQGGAYRKPRHAQFRVDRFMGDAAYERYGSPGQAFADVVDGLLDDLAGGARERLTALWLVRGWSSWFHGMAWDYTLFLIDPASRTVWLYCSTDRD
jgi:hypothetical protein